MRIVVLLTALTMTLGVRASNAGMQSSDEGTMLSLAGDWKYLPFEGPTNLADPAMPDADWPAMRLPSNWFLKGQKDYPVATDLSPVSPGAIVNPGDLAAAGPERGLDYAGTVWFRRHFTYTAGSDLAILRFDMVDYFADVYVNGHLAGHHEGSFQPFEFEVSRRLAVARHIVMTDQREARELIDHVLVVIGDNDFH